MPVTNGSLSMALSATGSEVATPTIRSSARALHPRDGLLPVIAVHDQLAEHAVVERGDLEAAEHGAVEARTPDRQAGPDA